MKLKLVRLASVYFHPISKELRSWSLRIGDIEVKTTGYREKEDKLNCLVAVEVPLPSAPKLTSDNLIVVPEIPRKQAEGALEVAVNTISVAKACKREIRSSIPFLAFLPEDDEARAWLETTNGIDVCTLVLPRCNVSIDLTNATLVNSLNDRLDGVELMAEALAHDHITGRFHEFMRLFERAFKLNRNGLIKPLTLFLNKPYYTETEIKKWVVDLRNPATHANKNYEYVLEADIRPVIEIIQQAAFDVIFNKAKWYDPSTESRSLFLPTTRVAPGDPPLYIRKGHTGDIGFQILDGFSAYPVDVSAGYDSLPNGYWSKTHEKMKSKRFGMKVEEEL